MRDRALYSQHVVINVLINVLVFCENKTTVVVLFLQDKSVRVIKLII